MLDRETQLVEILSEPNVFDGGEDNADVGRVSGDGSMCEDIAATVFVLLSVLVGDEREGLFVIAAARVGREATLEVDFLDLLLKQIPLVEEQNDGCMLEPHVVDDVAKQLERLVHSIDR